VNDFSARLTLNCYECLVDCEQLHLASSNSFYWLVFILPLSIESVGMDNAPQVVAYPGLVV
jgi:hypothetical protein